MGAPQIIYLVFIVLILADAALFHGSERTTRKNFYFDFFRIAIQMLILYWGGFFS